MENPSWQEATVINPLLIEHAQRVAGLLTEQKLKIVFTESCTAGLLALSLSQLPGISSHLCGSMVTYRNQTKAAWLGLDLAKLGNPSLGPVSAIVADQMCQSVLERTPDADLAVSITGHLGPDAPIDLDGVAYCGIVRRTGPDNLVGKVTVRRFDLPGEGASPLELRHRRQMAAAIFALDFVVEQLTNR